MPPFITKRKLQSTGSSYVISLPLEWFKNNKIAPEKIRSLTIVGNENLLILNPNNRLLYDLAQSLAKKSITLEEFEKAMRREVTF